MAHWSARSPDSRVPPTVSFSTGLAPSTVTVPAEANSWPATMRINVVLPVPIRFLCRLTRGNRKPCHPVGDRRVATARLAGQKTDGRGSQAVAWRAPAIGAAGLRWLHERDA